MSEIKENQNVDQEVNSNEDNKTARDYITNAYKTISSNFSKVVDKFRQFGKDVANDINNAMDKKEWESMVNDEWFVKFVNITILDYIKKLCNWKNKFTQLNKTDFEAIASIIDKPKFNDQLINAIENVYLPEIYNNYCTLANENKRIYKLNLNM